MSSTRLVERVEFSGRVLRLPGGPVVRGALLCGPSSANRRRYRREAFAGDRIKRYENRPVYLNHGDGRSGRTYQDRIATIRNPRHRQDGMPIADIVVNPAHPYADAFLWDAEHNPQVIGMSHVARCKTSAASDGWEEVEEVCEVESVDVVTDPATTRGLFESAARPRTSSFSEWVIRHPKSTTKQIAFARRVCREVAASLDDVDAGQSVRTGFLHAALDVFRKAIDGELELADALERLERLMKTHAATKDELADADPLDSIDTDDNGRADAAEGRRRRESKLIPGWDAGRARLVPAW